MNKSTLSIKSSPAREFDEDELVVSIYYINKLTESLKEKLQKLKDDIPGYSEFGIKQELDKLIKEVE